MLDSGGNRKFGRAVIDDNNRKFGRAVVGDSNKKFGRAVIDRAFSWFFF